MKKISILSVVCAVLFTLTGAAQNKYVPMLEQQLLKNHEMQLKSGVVGSYPQHIEEFSWTTSWVPYRTIDIQYNANGDPTVIEYNQGGSRTRDLFSYNSRHETTEVVNQSMATGSWVNQTRQVTIYGSHDMPTEFRNEQWMGGAWVLESGTQQSYEFNEDRVTVMISKNWDSGTSTWVNTSRETYTYSGSGVLYSTVVMDKWSGTAWTPNIKMDYTWSNNLPAVVINYLWENSAWAIQGKSVYSWTEPSFVVVQSNYDNGIYTDYMRITTTHDSHGNTTLSQAEMNFGVWTVFSSTRYTLTYSGNNLTQRITENMSFATGGTWSNTLKEVFSNFASLGTNPTILGDTGVSLFPNPAGSQVVVHLALKQSGSVSLSVVSMTGQLILTESVTANGTEVNHQLNLDKVRPGSYILIARDRNGNEIGKTRLVRE